MVVSGQLHDPAALHPGNYTPIPIGQEAGWAPEPVWTTWREAGSNSDTSAVQPTANRCCYYYYYYYYY
jgi:hypothetical protein